MRIAILASEGAPYIKSGGLGDVMEALPAALARIPGNEVMLILPYYHKVKHDPAWQTECIAQPLDDRAADEDGAFQRILRCLSVECRSHGC